MSAMARGTLALFRSVLVRPLYGEDLTPRQWRIGLSLRATLACLAVLIDLGILVMLGGSERIDQQALALFAWINLPLLTCDFFITLAMIRWSPLRKKSLVAALALVEAFTMVVWIQLTGTVTSYFIMAAALVILWYRLYFGWAVGMAYAFGVVSMHLGAFLLEIAGLLRPESAFVSPASKFYETLEYRWVAITSILWVYALTAMGANALVNRLREKDSALAELRREAERAAAGGKLGRLSDNVLNDRFAVGELLGRGGMGEIYMARSIADDVDVAIKVLHPHLADAEDLLERFRREAEAAARIPDQFTAKVLEIGSDEADQLFFIVMEYLRGEDLAAFMRRRGPLVAEELVALARGIGSALAAAHRVGIVHRDLKPPNIFLVEPPSGAPDSMLFDVRLLDFGVSKLPSTNDEPLTQTAAMLGTPGYMAPEQAMGRNELIGPAADCFSFGALLYRALTGKAPFRAGDLASWVNEVLHVDPPRPTTILPHLHRDVDAVFVLALAKDPAARYTDPELMVEDLERALGGALSPTTLARAVRLDNELVEAATVAAR